MLRLTRQTGAEIGTVSLLIRYSPDDGGTVRHVLTCARAARAQVAWALGQDGADTWRRIGLTPVIAAPHDLSPADASRLAAFAARNNLAWLSVRGAHPTPAATRVLSRLR
jgi:hypothetical protein